MLKVLRFNRTKLFLLLSFVTLLFVGIGVANAAPAGKSITVTVAVDKNIAKSMTVFGTGFSVNGKGKGSMGTRTTKTGPVGLYSFGFKSNRGDISCGKAVLKRDSNVLLYLSGNHCLNRVSPK